MCCYQSSQCNLQEGDPHVYTSNWKPQNTDTVSECKMIDFASRLVLMIFCNLPFITWQHADLIFIFKLCGVPDLGLLCWKIWLITLISSEKIQEEFKIINNKSLNIDFHSQWVCSKWFCLLCHFRKKSFNGLHNYAQGWGVKMKKGLQYSMNQPLGHVKNLNNHTAYAWLLSNKGCFLCLHNLI